MDSLQNVSAFTRMELTTFSPRGYLIMIITSPADKYLPLEHIKCYFILCQNYIF